MSVRLAAVLVVAVLLIFPCCGSMSGDTSGSQWNAAEQTEKDDYVRWPFYQLFGLIPVSRNRS